jgi:hypothetical protein
MVGLFVILAMTALSDGPIDFGKAQIKRALEGAGLVQRLGDVGVCVSGSGEPESFTLRFESEKVQVIAPDAVGAMYGCEEFAERIRQAGERAWSGEPVQAAPWLRDRGLNVFLTLPWDYHKNDTDYDPAALTDPQRWCFQNDEFWHVLLDEMARARLNWLDLHGTWDISRTDAPNLYAYFIQSDKYPGVGVAPEIKAANLRQLNHVVELAHARGVRVSLMAYEARITIPHNRTPPYAEDEELDYDYTREVVEKMIRQVPGLDAIGFRIGESGHRESFFRCYLEAVERSGRDIPLVTRSWLTRKANVVPLAAASNDFTVEIKYNGEQWGPPYLVMGGRVTGWHSYSFEDYLSDSGPGPFAHSWAGNRADERGGSDERWPSQPYKIVWQVRVNGTHRIFPFFEPQWVRQSIRAMKIGAASGFTIEPLNAYYPMKPGYYLANARDQAYDWTPQRDIAFMRLWGRLGYDPHTPDAAFEPTLRELYGSRADVIAAALASASRIVPTALAATCIGPDHRQHAPELEHGGDMASFLDRNGFDSHVFMSGKEMLANQATGGVDGRMTPLDAAALLEADVAAIRSAGLAVVDATDATARRCNEIAHAANMLSYLGEYYAARLRGGVALGLSEATEAQPFVAGAWAQHALAAWTNLSESSDATFYKPFTERLRMRRNDFHWRLDLPAVKADAARLGRDRRTIELPVTAQALPGGPEPELRWTASDDVVQCAIEAAGMTRAWLLHKPLPSSTFFHKLPMTRTADGAQWQVTIPRLAAGHALAAEIEQDGRVRRIPSWRDGAPYRLVPSLQKPTPPYYSSSQALSYLRPESLSPDDHGLLLIGSRAWSFHRRYDVPTQRKILDAVERGMTLVVLQQDYTSGRYPLDWLGPAKPKLENARLNVFDPGGALDLSKVETRDIIWQRFVPADGWEVIGNGGVAHARRGAGHIWLVQARLMQRMHVPAAAQALLQLLRSGVPGKPVVIVDYDTEGAPMTTSTLADFMNSHDVPFVTLGEVIADRQGMDCHTVVPG